MKTVLIETSTITPAEAYRILLACVSPRPIAFVSTCSALGTPNLAPFSFFMAGGSNPPSVMIAPTIDRLGHKKDTQRNIEETGEYVINVVTYAMCERMNVTSAEYPYGISEWTEAGFMPEASHIVAPARVSESPLSMECLLYKIVTHGEGPSSANYVIGEVVCFHVAEELLTDGKIDPTKVDYIGRMSGDYYTRVNSESMFELPRPPRVEKYARE
jgi:flavin reductase (DIM6/NTAB) family NADH-FMN oxidoreductase RutF